MNFSFESIQSIIFLILIKLALIMIVAAMLANFNYFSDKLFSGRKSLSTRYKISMVLCSTLLVGIILRFSANYHALDFSIPGLFIIGIVAGFLPSITAALIVSIALISFSSEYFSILLSFVAAFAGSIFFMPDLFETKKNIYRFSIGMLPVTVIVAVIYRYAPPYSMFTLSNRTFAGDLAVAVSDLAGVFLMLFLWKHYKTKIELVDSAHNLSRAKLAILSSKINPHFLFNTLNTIASAIRINPNVARNIVFKLSEIMRYVLDTENEFKTLKDEIVFIENYLSIESLRLGESRLRVDVNVDDDTSEVRIPTMLIQPIVENAIKHGIAPLTDRKGELSIRTIPFREDRENYVKIEIVDNGMGMEMDEATLYAKGIGLSNVRDRLRILYGDNAKLSFSSVVGDGTTANIIIPVWR